MKNTVLAALMAIFLLASCTAGHNSSENIANSGGSLAGFWSGLWHGIISPFTFVVSLFSNKVGIYEVHNNGGWYNFGFILGGCIIFGGGSKASSRKK
jgi:hypothetical protein